MPLPKPTHKILDVTQFTRAVAGNRAVVTQLLPPNTSPHDYQARPSDAQMLNQARLLVKNGLEMEEFLNDLVANTQNPNLKVIDSTHASNLRTLLAEPAIGASAFRGIATDLNAQVSTFDSLEVGALAAQDPEHYLKVMRQNLQNLKAAFGRGITSQTRLSFTQLWAGSLDGSCQYQRCQF